MLNFHNRKKYNSEYFLTSNISNYTDYRVKKFKSMAKDIINILFLSKDDTLLDFGCATGGLIKTLKDLGIINVKGTDISYWAINYGKNTLGLHKELDYYNENLLYTQTNYILMLDVLEHLPIYLLKEILPLARHGLKKALLVRIPVSLNEGEDYFLNISCNDKTHLAAHSSDWWETCLNKYGFKLIEKVQTPTLYCSNGVFVGKFI